MKQADELLFNYEPVHIYNHVSECILISSSIANVKKSSLDPDYMYGHNRYAALGDDDYSKIYVAEEFKKYTNFLHDNKMALKDVYIPSFNNFDNKRRLLLAQLDNIQFRIENKNSYLVKQYAFHNKVIHLFLFACIILLLSFIALCVYSFIEYSNSHKTLKSIIIVFIVNIIGCISLLMIYSIVKSVFGSLNKQISNTKTNLDADNFIIKTIKSFILTGQKEVTL